MGYVLSAQRAQIAYLLAYVVRACFSKNLLGRRLCSAFLLLFPSLQISSAFDTLKDDVRLPMFLLFLKDIKILFAFSDVLSF
jgi:hypothetical protein